MASPFTGEAGGFSSQSFDSQQFESFTSYAEGGGEPEEVVAAAAADDDVDVDDGDVADGSTYAAGDEAFTSPERDGKGPILPPPEVMLPEEGSALREWRRENAIRLEAKEKREKQILQEIIEEAEEYKAEYYQKWKVRLENNSATNREKEKLFLESQAKFHAEASKNYWKTIAELIPKEVPNIEKKGKKKDEDKKPSIVVIQGPKPGKPTDLSRMRQILVKLKHNPLPHMKSLSPPPTEPGKDAKTGPTSPASPDAPPQSPPTASV